MLSCTSSLYILDINPLIGYITYQHLLPFSSLSFHFVNSFLHREKLLSFAVVLCYTKTCLTLCNAMDCSLPGSSVHGILWARISEWIAIPFSRGFSQPKDRIWVSCIAGGFSTAWATKEATSLTQSNLFTMAFLSLAWGGRSKDILVTLPMFSFRSFLLQVSYFSL